MRGISKKDDRDFQRAATYQTPTLVHHHIEPMLKVLTLIALQKGEEMGF